MPGPVFLRQGFSSDMYSYSTNLDYSLQQIPYPCRDSSYEYTDSSDRLEKLRVVPYCPAKQTSKPLSQQPSVLPVPDLDDVDALLSKPRFSTDTSFDPDPKFPLFEQSSVYEKLPGSYVDQPLGSLYPNALNTELKHTLAEAWRFNPAALSNRCARETAFDLARTPGHGLKQEVVSWVRSIGLSRVQAQIREREFDDIAAKNCLVYEHCAELHDGYLPGLMDVGTLREELDDFYDPPAGEADANNPLDYRHYHDASRPSHPPSAEPHGIDGSVVDKILNELSINTTRTSLPARRGWLGDMPAHVSTAGPSKHTDVRVDHGYGVASLPTPDTATRFAPANHNNRVTMAGASSIISPPLTSVSFAPANHNYFEVTIPAGHATPGATSMNTAHSPPDTACQVTQASHQNHAIVGPINEPTFEARLAPLEPKPTGKRTAPFRDSCESAWEGREEGPYDLIDFCSTNSDLSDVSEPTVIAEGIDGATTRDTAMPNASGMDGFALPETSMPDANDNDDGVSRGTAMSDAVTEDAIDMAVRPEGPAGAAKQDVYSQADSLEEVPTETIVIGNTTETTTPNAIEESENRTPRPEGTPAQAMILAQDLEHCVHSAVSQTTSLTRVWGQPSPLVLPEPVIAVPKPQDLKRHGGCPEESTQPTNKRVHNETTSEHHENKVPQTQPTVGLEGTYIMCYEPPQFHVNEFTTPVPCRAQNVPSASLMEPKSVNLTPEYNSESEDDNRASPDRLSSGVLSSPTNRILGGHNALSHFVRETSSHQTLAAHDSVSMCMSISSASSLSSEPEDMALTPTHADFDPDYLTLGDPLEAKLALTPTHADFDLDCSTPSDPLEADVALTPTHADFDPGPEYLTLGNPLEEVSLIEDCSNAIISSRRTSNTSSATLNALEQFHTPNKASAYSPYVNASGPRSRSCCANPVTAPAPALTTPNNNSTPIHHPHTPFQLSTAARALVLPPTTPCTPTPAQRASDQHHPKRPSGAVLRHKNPGKEKKMRKSVKSVFESKQLGSSSPSPGKEAASDGGVGLGRRFVMETGHESGVWGWGVKQTTKPTPAQAAPVPTLARTRSHDKVGRNKNQAELGMMKVRSQDQFARAVVVTNKRKQTIGSVGEVRKRRRSTFEQSV